MKNVRAQVTVVFNVSVPYPELADDPPAVPINYHDGDSDRARRAARDIVNQTFRPILLNRTPRMIEQASSSKANEAEIIDAYITHSEIVEEL